MNIFTEAKKNSKTASFVVKDNGGKKAARKRKKENKKKAELDALALEKKKVEDYDKLDLKLDKKMITVEETIDLFGDIEEVIERLKKFKASNKEAKIELFEYSIGYEDWEARAAITRIETNTECTGRLAYENEEKLRKIAFEKDEIKRKSKEAYIKELEEKLRKAKLS